MFATMFERADIFIAFVAFTIFLDFVSSLHFGLSLFIQHGDPSFSHFFKLYTHIDILWKFYKDPKGTSAQISSGMTIMSQTAKYGVGYFYLWNNDESKKALKIISGTTIVFAQMFEHTHKFIAWQPAELRKNVSKNGRVIKGTLIIPILKTNMVTPIVFTQV